MLQSFFGKPLFRPLICDDFDVAAVDRGLQNVQLSFSQQMRIIIGRRSAYQNVIARWLAVEKIFRLQLADAFIIERNVKVGSRIFDQPIVRDHRHILPFREVDNRTGNFGVMRHDHEDVDTLGQQALGLFHLQIVVAICGLQYQLCPEFFAPSLKHRLILLPAFLLKRVHQKTDPDLLICRRGSICGAVLVCRRFASARESDDKRNDGE